LYDLGRLSLIAFHFVKSFSIFGVNSNIIEKLLLNTLNYSFLLPLVSIFLLYRKISKKGLIIVLALYLILFFLLNVYYSQILSSLGRNLYYFIYTFCEYSTFAYIMWQSTTNKRFKKLIIILSGLFAIFLSIFYSTVKISRIDSVAIGIETIILITFIIYFFYLSFKNLNNGNIYDDASFWLVTGILVYLGSTFFFNILGDSLNQEHFKLYFYYSYFGDILKNILFAVAIFFFSRMKRKANSESFNVPYLDMI
jgi:hypothetical protein